MMSVHVGGRLADSGLSYTPTTQDTLIPVPFRSSQLFWREAYPDDVRVNFFNANTTQLRASTQK
jgi:hypothetical protein